MSAPPGTGPGDPFSEHARDRQPTSPEAMHGTHPAQRWVGASIDSQAPVVLSTRPPATLRSVADGLRRSEAVRASGFQWRSERPRRCGAGHHLPCRRVRPRLLPKGPAGNTAKNQANPAVMPGDTQRSDALAQVTKYQPACLTTRRPQQAIRPPGLRFSFATLACRARCTVKYTCARFFPPPGSRLFPSPGLRLVLTALSPTSPRLAVRHAGWQSVVKPHVAPRAAHVAP